MSFNAAYPHSLDLLPPRFNYKNPAFMDLLIKARTELAELKGHSSGLPNQLLLLSPAIIKESLASSEIENINTTIINVLENQLFPEAEQKKPDKEVLRYRDAVLEGYESLKKFAFSTRTIIEVHKKLLKTSAGQYRRNQNKIENSSTKEVIYTPPPPTKIGELMGNLENFINREDDIDPLIKCAIMHYQFEAIHPFSDGNGRTGRILMILYLVKESILYFPILYISGYINAPSNKKEYYRLLLNVTKKEGWIDFVLFMLRGFYLQGKETKSLLLKIKDEYYRFKDNLKSKHKKIYSGDLVDSLFSFPIITPAKLAEDLGCHRNTATNYLRTLTQTGILTDRKVGKYHFYANKGLLNILHK